MIHFRSSIAWVFFLIALSNCSKSGNLSKDCGVQADQKASFMPRVEHFPIQVKADVSFTDQEKDSISATIREWNQTGRSRVGFELFTLRYESVPSNLRSLDPHDCSSDLGEDRAFYIVRERNQGHWNSIGFKENTPGATIRCYNGDQFQRQIIFINPSLMNQSQFDQAFAHELGHSLGLEHSCNSTGNSPDYIGCSLIKGNSSHPYFNAVMFPVLKNKAENLVFTNYENSFSSPARVSSVLNINDATRAQCVTGEAD